MKALGLPASRYICVFMEVCRLGTNPVFPGGRLSRALLLPFVTAQIPSIGSMLLPMHIPVLLCGFLCGWPFGLLVGAVTPLLRSVLFGMPPMMPTAVAMAFELSAYGAAAGLLMTKLPKTYAGALAALIASMLAGRVVWGFASFLLYTLMGSSFTWQLFFAGAFVKALPGIVVQIALIPALAAALWKAEKRFT